MGAERKEIYGEPPKRPSPAEIESLTPEELYHDFLSDEEVSLWMADELIAAGKATEEIERDEKGEPIATVIKMKDSGEIIHYAPFREAEDPLRKKGN